MKQLKIDVMLNGGGRFYKTLVYSWNPLYKFNFDDMVEWVMNKLPSLKNRKDVQLILYDKRYEE